MYVTLGDVFFVALRRWKQFLLFLIAGVLMTLIIANVMGKTYSKKLLLVSPPQSVVESAINQLGDSIPKNGILAKTKLIAESDVIIDKFIQDSAFNSKVHTSGISAEYFTARIQNKLSIEGVYEGSTEDSVGVLVGLEIKLNWHDERFAVDFLNRYADFLNKQLRSYYRTEAVALIEARTVAIEQEVEELRTSARNLRLFTIRRLTSENQEEVKKIDRQLEILKGNTLRDIEQQLILISEAKKIARELGIEKPTPLEELNQPEGHTITNIKLADSDKTLPLYLMGEKYLKALEESLESREDPLKYSEEANRLLKQKELIKNDPELENLKNRQSDDEFIPELASLLTKKQSLEQYINGNLDSLDMVEVSRAARMSGVPDSPSKLMVVLVGSVVSLILSFLLLILIEVYKRTEVTQKG